MSSNSFCKKEKLTSNLFQKAKQLNHHATVVLAQNLYDSQHQYDFAIIHEINDLLNGSSIEQIGKDVLKLQNVVEIDVLVKVLFLAFFIALTSDTKQSKI